MSLTLDRSAVFHYRPFYAAQPAVGRDDVFSTGFRQAGAFGPPFDVDPPESFNYYTNDAKTDPLFVNDGKTDQYKTEQGP